MIFEKSINFAEELDRQDPLKAFRDQFLYPEINGKKTIYFCGNSLGLQPKKTIDHLQTELEDWKNLAVEGHFRGTNPWFEYHKFLKKGLVELTGAKDGLEVTPMGSLTSNLHLMMVSFFRPTNQRYKIIMESGAFPSDQYAVETQCRFHGLDPADAVIELAPKPGAYILETADVINCIEENRERLALVLMSGIQYFSGQLFDIETITRAGHQAGAMIGWDLAHAIGNVPLFLHDQQVDFAVWCSYKYLNSGPGGTAGIFVHENHGRNGSLPRFGGWWGHAEEERFQMKKGFKPMTGSDGWQLSNANILSMAAQKASLDIFLAAGIDNIRKKSLLLTGYLNYLLQEAAMGSGIFQVITPKENRGCQLSLWFHDKGKRIFQELLDQSIIVDWREPNCIRVSPVPLYNSFQEVFEFSQVLKKLLV